MNRGYVRLWRRTADSRVFQNEGLLKVWIWCLLRANHKEIWVSIKTGRGQTEVLLKPGQFIFGRDSAAKKLRMKPTTVWGRMLKLKTLGNIDIESHRQYSIITIINWESYQAPNEKNDSENDYRMTGKRQPNDTDKNDKHYKNNKYVESAKKILEKINSLSGKNFKNYDPILAVLKSKTIKATESDCLKVVEFKWKDKYIRENGFFTPASLFRITKFKAKLDEAKNTTVEKIKEPRTIRAGDPDILANE